MTASRFDESVDRTTYPTMKLNRDSLYEHFGNPDAMPFWVADMDFLAPDAVIDSLRARAEHGIYGYEYKPDSYYDALLAWYVDRHQWQIKANTIEACPGVLNAVSIIINQHTEEGDGVIIQPPVFFEFRMVIRDNGRKQVKNSLRLVDGRYEIDFDDLVEKAAAPENKVMILCNPHNPIGRVWTREELQRAGDICQQNGVLLIADEIHGDIVYPPHRYTPLASVSEEIARNAVICLSPAKTFNIAGMVDAMVVIENEAIRQEFHDFAHRYQINKTNVFSSAAIETAYREGGDWVDSLLAYLKGNIEFMQAYLAEHLPQVKLIEPEGTYLVWLDFREMGMDAKVLARFLGEDVGLAVNPGHWFGREGAGFARMNIACPRSSLQTALDMLTEAVTKL